MRAGGRLKGGGWASFAALGLTALLVLVAAAEKARGAAAWTMQPPSWDFGVIEPSVGPSPAAVFTVTNTGDVTLTIYASGVGWFGPVGTDPELFQLDSDGCFDASPLAPGESCTIEASFDPTTPGPKSGLINLSATDRPLTEGTDHAISVKSKLSGIGAGAYAGEPPQPLPPPRVILRKRPPHKTTKRAAGFWFDGSAGTVRFLCGLDGKPLRRCGSPARFQRLSVGRHAFTVVAADSSGIYGPKRTYRWTIEPKQPGRVAQS